MKIMTIWMLVMMAAIMRITIARMRLKIMILMIRIIVITIVFLTLMQPSSSIGQGKILKKSCDACHVEN